MGIDETSPKALDPPGKGKFPERPLNRQRKPPGSNKGINSWLTGTRNSNHVSAACLSIYSVTTSGNLAIISWRPWPTWDGKWSQSPIWFSYSREKWLSSWHIPAPQEQDRPSSKSYILTERLSVTSSDTLEHLSQSPPNVTPIIPDTSQAMWLSSERMEGKSWSVMFQ